VSLQKSLPVITSILIILAVALLRERSRTLSAILGTMPINMVLALWIVMSVGDSAPQSAADFVRALMIGLAPTYVWLFVVYGALNSGWQVWPAVLAGYGVWGALIGIAFWLGIFSVQR
jgi:hypothetical protein